MLNLFRFLLRRSPLAEKSSSTAPVEGRQENTSLASIWKGFGYEAQNLIGSVFLTIEDDRYVLGNRVYA